MTSQTRLSRDAKYFKALYDADPDPWNFSGSQYEHQKYSATMAALAGKTFSRGFEIGCSIGVLTRILAPQCNELFAVDLVETALAAARARCCDMPNVTVANLRVPEEWPAAQKFDLILLSEVLYFLNKADIDLVAAHTIASLLPGGIVLLVNYTSQIDEPNSGDQAAEIFISATQATLSLSLHARHEKFRIDRLDLKRGFA